MDYEQILGEQRDEIVLFTLNRPDKLNAWTRDLPLGKASPPPGTEA